MSDIEKIWKNFLISSKERIKLTYDKLDSYVISEDSFRMDLGYQISDSIGSPQVFAEFPCHGSRSQRWDLCFFDNGSHCIEIKYMRPIPSGKNRPRTQHYGSILSDLFKLKLYSKDDSELYFILIVDEKFHGYLKRKGFTIQKSDLVERTYRLEDLPKTAKREIHDRLETDIPDVFDLSIKSLDHRKIKDLHFNLLKIEAD